MGDKVETFTILICAPNEFMATIHNRMSVILAQDGWPTWLGERCTGPVAFAGAVQTVPICPNDFVGGVAARVGSAKNTDAMLVEPLPEAAEPLYLINETARVHVRTYWSLPCVLWQSPRAVLP